MPDASFNQPNFLGGEWSPEYQGRQDNPRYKTAMNVCLNGLPLEEGAWARRQGSKFVAMTRNGNPARLMPFNYSGTLPYFLEFTDGHLRIFNGDDLVLEPVVSVTTLSTANPAQVTLGVAQTWATGDEIEIIPTGGSYGDLANLTNRQFKATKVDTTHFTLTDPYDGTGLDGNVDGNNWGTSTTASAARIVDFTTPYTAAGSWYDCRGTQFNQQLIVWNPSYASQVLKITSANASAGRFSTFTFGAATFLDGPYWPPVTGQSVTAGGNTSPVTLTITGGLHPDLSGAVAGDVGKLVRLFQEPPDWSSGTAYTLYPAAGSIVKFNGVYFTCIQSNTNKPPDQFPAYWTPDPEGAQWVWGSITTVTNSTTIIVTLDSSSNAINTFYGTDARFTIFRLGMFGGADGYPNNGCFHEGRVWGCMGNTIFSSQPDDPFNMAPTLSDGTVTDASAITETFEGGESDANAVQWMNSDDRGIVCGTYGAEWLVSASALSDPITATNIQAKKITKYGSANVNPIRTGLALIFVQKYRQRLMEMIADVFTGRYRAPDLALASRHLTRPQIEEIAYQEDFTPIVWTRMRDGSLKGVTYRRVSSYGTEEPTFVGWHRHVLGSERNVQSLIMTSIPVPVEVTG